MSEALSYLWGRGDCSGVISLVLSTFMMLRHACSSAYVSIRQHTFSMRSVMRSACVSIRCAIRARPRCCQYSHTSAYVSIRQHTSAYLLRHPCWFSLLPVLPILIILPLVAPATKPLRCQHLSFCTLSASKLIYIYICM